MKIKFKPSRYNYSIPYNNDFSFFPRFLFILIGLFFLFCTKATAQETGAAKIVGCIIDSEDGKPVPYASCMLLNSADSSFIRGTTSNQNGEFVFSGIATDSLILSVKCSGYNLYFSQIRLLTDSLFEIVRLHRNNNTLKVVSVSAERPLYSEEGEKMLYNVEDDPSAKTGTISDALQNAPGVEVDAEGNVRLRGSSVEVWFNNRPSHMDAQTLKQYIKSMPAVAVKRIEVIDNPSARYNSGSPIINIVTTTQVPLKQLLCIGASTNTRPDVSPWISYVWANDRVSVNVYGNLTLNHNVYDQEYTSRFFASDSTLSSFYHYDKENKQFADDWYFGANVDYAINDCNSLSGWINYFPNHQKNSSNYNVEGVEYVYSPGNYDYLYFHDGVNNNRGGDLGLWYEYRIDSLGQSFQATLTGNFSVNDGRNNFNRDYVFQPLDYMYRMHYDSDPIGTNLSLRWIKPYSKNGKIDAGITAGFSQNSSNYDWDTMNYASDVYVRDPYRSYKSNNSIQQVTPYITVQQKIDRMTVKLGLNYQLRHQELTYYDCFIEDPTRDYDVEKSYSSVTPSLHASYSTDKGHNFSFSYVFRTSNPSAQMLSDYIVLNEQSFQRGNPLLTSGHTHTSNLRWTCFRKWGNIGVMAYFKAENDICSQLSDVAYSPFFGRIVDYTSYRNVGNTRDLGIEYSMVYRPWNFVNIRFYAMLYDNYYKMEYRPDNWAESEMMSYRLRMNVWAKMWKKYQLFVNATYNGRLQPLLSTSDPLFYMDLGVSTEFSTGGSRSSLMCVTC